ncbi:hypothetical protein ACFL3G_11770, partial [Planctomycetota bacterium]
MCKRVILMVFFLALPAVAGVSNPEDFESYPPTATDANWEPNIVEQGWSDFIYEYSLKILSAGGPDGSQALQVWSSDNASGIWHATAYGSGILKFTFDGMLEVLSDGHARISFEIGEDYNGRNCAFVELRTPGGASVWCRDMDWNVYQEYMPGWPSSTGEIVGRWFSVEMIMNFDTQRTKARFGWYGEAMNGWSNEIPFLWNSPVNFVWLRNSNGTIRVDNLKLARESNPEDFEGYSATSDWQPNELNEGWELFGMAGPNEILAGYSHDGSQALKLTADPSVYGTGFWYTKADANGILIFKTDCKLESGGTNTRIGLQLGGDIDIHGGV